METKENWNETCNFGQLLIFTAFLSLLSQGSPRSLDITAGQEGGKFPWVGLLLGLLAEANSPASEPWSPDSLPRGDVRPVLPLKAFLEHCELKRLESPMWVQFCVRLHVTVATRSSLEISILTSLSLNFPT